MLQWREDDKWQKGVRNRFLPSVYSHLFKGYTFLDGENSPLVKILQRKFGVDTSVNSKKGDAYFFEEKLERWPPNNRPRANFALETDSCTVPGREKPGWMCYSMADYLLYGFMQQSGDELDLYILKMQPLQEWFKKVCQNYPYTIKKDTLNKTGMYLVPIGDALRAPDVAPRHFRVTDNEVTEKELAFTLSTKRRQVQRRRLETLLDMIEKARQEQADWEDGWEEGDEY